LFHSDGTHVIATQIRKNDERCAIVVLDENGSLCMTINELEYVKRIRANTLALGRIGKLDHSARIRPESGNTAQADKSRRHHARMTFGATMKYTLKRPSHMMNAAQKFRNS
jgi:hypothetical protein